MYPKDGKYVCIEERGGCGAVEEIVEKEHHITNVNGKELTVEADAGATLPKTRILCPNCGNTEAYFRLEQTRSADEPETRIYRCCKCNHSWREY